MVLRIQKLWRGFQMRNSIMCKPIDAKEKKKRGKIERPQKMGMNTDPQIEALHQDFFAFRKEMRVDALALEAQDRMVRVLKRDVTEQKVAVTRIENTLREIKAMLLGENPHVASQQAEQKLESSSKDTTSIAGNVLASFPSASNPPNAWDELIEEDAD